MDSALGKRVAVKWEPRDLWLGVYWDRTLALYPPGYTLKVYVCLLPCLPIILTLGYVA